MAKKKVKRRMPSRSVKRQKDRTIQPFWSMVTLLIFVLLMLYLGGKVHIEYVLRETDKLNAQRLALNRRITDLSVQVHALQSYDRIVDEAQKQGLIFVRHADIADLKVNLQGIEDLQDAPKSQLQMARLLPF